MAKSKKITETITIDPDSLSPSTPAEYSQRGWLYYSRGQFEKAENDFRHSINQQPEDLDTQYALGLTLKNLDRLDEAVKIFEAILERLPEMKERVRATMIQRLSKGHINEMTIGDWNLEKEVWKRK